MHPASGRSTRTQRVEVYERTALDLALSCPLKHTHTHTNNIHTDYAAGDAERVREVYERAVSNLPPGSEKRYWRRYIYLWVKYAVWEELEAGDSDRAREVYRCAVKCLACVRL